MGMFRSLAGCESVIISELHDDTTKVPIQVLNRRDQHFLDPCSLRSRNPNSGGPPGPNNISRDTVNANAGESRGQFPIPKRGSSRIPRDPLRIPHLRQEKAPHPAERRRAGSVLLLRDLHPICGSAVTRWYRHRDACVRRASGLSDRAWACNMGHVKPAGRASVRRHSYPVNQHLSMCGVYSGRWAS
jgi:hypothetical protein